MNRLRFGTAAAVPAAVLVGGLVGGCGQQVGEPGASEASSSQTSQEWQIRPWITADSLGIVEDGEVNAHPSYFPAASQYDVFYDGWTWEEMLADKVDEGNKEGAGNHHDVASVVASNIYGGVLPHHLFVGQEMARYFTILEKRFAGRPPDVIVVVGPNHFGAGAGPILTTDLPYTSPYGSVEPDLEIIAALARSGLVEIDREPFHREHAISAETAFLARHFPSTKIVPIILSDQVVSQDADRLAKLLVETLPDNALVLASVDFSHYQPGVVADFHDQISRLTVLNFMFPELYDLEIDSPASLYTLLSYLRRKEATTPLYEVHTNVASYSGQLDIEETTSHFFWLFGKIDEDLTPKITSGDGILLIGDDVLPKDKALQYDGINVLMLMRGMENRFFRGVSRILWANTIGLEGPDIMVGDFPRGGTCLNLWPSGNSQQICILDVSDGFDRAAAQQLIDAGAAIVIGRGGPHLELDEIPPLQTHRGRPIIPALGPMAVGVFATDHSVALYFYPFKDAHTIPQMLGFYEREDFYQHYFSDIDFGVVVEDIPGKIVFPFI